MPDALSEVHAKRRDDQLSILFQTRLVESKIILVVSRDLCSASPRLTSFSTQALEPAFLSPKR